MRGWIPEGLKVTENVIHGNRKNAKRVTGNVSVA
jgi:hypothetical protein